MREDLLLEIEREYAQQRQVNEETEAQRREKIRREQPEIAKAMDERDRLIFGTIRQILAGDAEQSDLTARMKELNARIGTMLEAAGYTAGYLEPVYRCKTCRDTGYTGDAVKTPCECMKRAYQEKVRSIIGLDSAKEETFETYNESLIPDEAVNGSGIT